MRRLLLATGLLLFTLPGCHSNEATPACYSGVVLGEYCWDGVLIQVDRQYPIGKSIVAGATDPDSLGSTNVIAALNSLGSLAKRGQRIYFTYEEYTNQPIVNRFCTADRAPLGVPHLVLTNTSATPCNASLASGH
ncbi:hypothetical protein FNT36_12000 [Hymenobacter setariae]|uniref:Uncharacterized protein n=1 Tax=Hymenobacter setariae TaxID=2594794 RepID=A0A558BUK9_9BACT|nr:hypothetical protein [Hymenobacter setariae]TVT40207.1 hypothetical protein FNT36_12000 [Hymenobacter setariae]